MARRRFQAPELVGLLELAPQPLYVLDDTLAIVFMNEACRNWLGGDAEDLLGRRCVYQSGNELTGPDAVAARLCPPPAVLEGREVAADVAKSTELGTVYRRGRFVPLMRSETEPLCVLAMLDEQDRSEAEPEAYPQIANESLDLHDSLLRFRRQTALRYRTERVVGVGPAMRRAKAQAELAAASRASVLLIGPPGSGRRHLAEVIHYSCPSESCGMLVPMDCALLGADLVQSTMLALTSRQATRAAGSNTLLLCDADQLPIESQGALFAILAAARFPLRLMATFAAPLVDLVSRGLYRDDLAALLSTIAIELPPLVERRADLPLLAQALLEERNGRGTKQLGGFTPEAMDRICGYGWPGNVTELADAVAIGHAHAAGSEVKPEDLPERLRLAAEAAERPRRKEEPIVLEEFTMRIERELIQRALARSRGNKSKAARMLGMNRPRLYRKMVQLGLAKEGEGDLGEEKGEH